ncbi:hypothetical protein [Nonomuraea sp. JJY05]|uniref:hypothetical protein n=1 Tax=Nonomuraea sp. JJY05 TaxID=3350255 RepID=UPI00373F0C29
MGEAGRARMEGLLVVGPDGKSTFNRLKKSAQRATWSRLRDQVAWLDQLDGIAPSKITDFAGADAQDAGTLSRYNPVKQVALRSVTNCPNANQTPAATYRPRTPSSSLSQSGVGLAQVWVVGGTSSVKSERTL